MKWHNRAKANSGQAQLDRNYLARGDAVNLYQLWSIRAKANSSQALDLASFTITSGNTQRERSTATSPLSGTIGQRMLQSLSQRVTDHEHRLEQVNCRKGVIAGTVFDGHQEAGQASVSCWRSKKDGQVYEREPHGTCQTCVGQAPAASQHVSMYIEAGIGPGRCPILQHCQWPCSVGPETHALLWNHQVFKDCC